MAQKPLSDKTLRDTLAFYDAARGVAADAAKLAGVPVNTFRSRLQDARNRLGIQVPTAVVDKGVARRAKDLSELGQLKKEVVILREALSAKSKAPKILTPKFRRASDEDEVWVVMPDSHGSHADPAAMPAFLGDLPSLKPKRLIALGDQIDCGGFLAQHHTMGYLAQLDESAYADDLEAWRVQLDTITEAAGGPLITLLEGNHEQRLEKWAVQQTIGNRKDARC